MNILVFSWRGPGHPLAGGAEQVDHEHHKGWIAAGHNVTLFTSKFVGCKKEEVIDGVRVIRSGYQYTCLFNAFFWYLFGKHEKFDFVVDEFHGWPFFTPLYVGKPKMAVIQEVTKEVWFDYPLPYGLQYIIGPIAYILEPLFFLPYRNVKFMIGSESAKKEVNSFGILNKNIIVVTHGVILNLPSKRPPKNKIKTVVFLGALSKDKGIEDAIKTFAILNKQDDYIFWVIGKSDKDYLNYLKKMAFDLGLKKKITFFGYVSQKEKFELLARAHVMINPSIREGWGLVNIEANAMAIPVVAYDSPGLVDSVKDGESGIVCKKNAPKEMAKNVMRVLGNKKELEHLQKGALSWSKQFDWNVSKKLSLALIEEIGLK